MYSGELPISGSLRAALILEFPAGECVSVSNPVFNGQLRIIGNKGRLPNMDLVNVVTNSVPPGSTRIEGYVSTRKMILASYFSITSLSPSLSLLWAYIERRLEGSWQSWEGSYSERIVSMMEFMTALQSKIPRE